MPTTCLERVGQLLRNRAPFSAAGARCEVGFGSKTVLTPLKWDVCFTPESRHRSATLPMAMSIRCYGGAKLTDKHLASKVHCVDSRKKSPGQDAQTKRARRSGPLC